MISDSAPALLVGVLAERSISSPQADEPPKSVTEILREGSQIDAAIPEAARITWLAHKREGVPIPVWKDGKTVWTPPEEIEIPDDWPRRR
jgi:hypothetical protein